MAGIHCCYRRLSALNTSRLIDRNGIFLQLTRKKHHVVFQIASLKSIVTLQRPKSRFNANKLLLYRLASTSIIESKVPISNVDLKISEPKNDSSQFKNETAHFNNEQVQLSKESENIASSNSNVIDEDSLPPIPSEVPEMDFISMGLKEPSFQSLGLGSWWPSGIIQQILEFLHINLDLPWWESICLITLMIRTLLLPLTIKNRRDSIHMMNHIPYISEFQEKINEAKSRGDHFNVAFHVQELQNYVKNNNVNLTGVFKVALVQAPIFISMFYGLKGMSNVPVESLKTGGLFWFQDLTQPDPYYALPVILAASIWAVIEFPQLLVWGPGTIDTSLIFFQTGSEGNPASAQNFFLKWILRGIPVLVLIFSLKFAACITWYWTISNLISLCQVGFFKIPVIKKFLKLPDINAEAIKIHKKKKNKGFLEGFKEGIENAKITNQIQDRERMNLAAFEKAGSGPIPRTFKKNPVLQNVKKS